MTTIVRPVKPTRPQELCELIAVHNASVRAANGAIRGMVHGMEGMGEAFTRYSAEAAGWTQEILRWYAETEEGRAYEAAVQKWNAYVQASREERKIQSQARRNAHEVATVRSAACTRCFSTHAGEC